MSYDWRGETLYTPGTPEWFDEQDRRNAAAHAHFASRQKPFDRLIPYHSLAGKDVLEIGVGSGFHAELLARAGARVTGVDLTEAAVACTRRRFELKGLDGEFIVRDAELPNLDFLARFDFVWSWGVVHHAARTARIVRNVSEWLRDDGQFGGMVYHRDSLLVGALLLRSWILHGKLFRQSIDEVLWEASDGFSARFYPSEQWRDLLFGFFDEADVDVTGKLEDVAPLPRWVRGLVLGVLSERRRAAALARGGGFITFSAGRPIRQGGV